MDISTNTVKARIFGEKPKDRVPIMSAKVKPKARSFDFDPARNPEAAAMARPYKKGQPAVHSSQLREMAANKRRLEVSAALKAARAKIASAGTPAVKIDPMAKARAAKAAKAKAKAAAK